MEREFANTIVKEINKHEFVSSGQISKIFFPESKIIVKEITSFISRLIKRGYLEFHEFKIVSKKKHPHKIFKRVKEIPEFPKYEKKIPSVKYIILVETKGKTGVVCRKKEKTIVSFDEETISKDKITFKDKIFAKHKEDVINKKLGKEYQTKLICI